MDIQVSPAGAVFFIIVSIIYLILFFLCWLRYSIGGVKKQSTSVNRQSRMEEW